MLCCEIFLAHSSLNPSAVVGILYPLTFLFLIRIMIVKSYTSERVCTRDPITFSLISRHLLISCILKNLHLTLGDPSYSLIVFIALNHPLLIGLIKYAHAMTQHLFLGISHNNTMSFSRNSKSHV